MEISHSSNRGLSDGVSRAPIDASTLKVPSRRKIDASKLKVPPRRLPQPVLARPTELPKWDAAPVADVVRGAAGRGGVVVVVVHGNGLPPLVIEGARLVAAAGDGWLRPPTGGAGEHPET